MKKTLLILFFHLSLISLFAQEENIQFPWLIDEGWQISKTQTKESSSEIMLNAYAGDAVGQELSITRLPYLVPMSIEQIFGKILDEEKPNCQRAKLTIVEKHTGFDVAQPWGLYLIECSDYLGEGKARSIMYFLKKGEYATFLVYRSAEVAKLKGKTKKAWTRFFREAELVSQEAEKVYKALGWKNPH